MAVYPLLADPERGFDIFVFFFPPSPSLFFSGFVTGKTAQGGLSCVIFGFLILRMREVSTWLLRKLIRGPRLFQFAQNFVI